MGTPNPQFSLRSARSMEQPTVMEPLPRPATAPDAAPGPTKRDICMVILFEYLLVTWLDILSMVVVGGMALAVEWCPIPVKRTFPLMFSESGDIVYPHLAYPDRGWIIPSLQAGLITIFIPIGIYMIAQVKLKSFWDFHASVMGTLWAVLLGATFQVVLKLLIGGFRPSFLEVCQPDLGLAAKKNESGLNGVGYQSMMYSTDICTQTSKKKLRNAITSFPSGHSTSAFAGFGFLFLWLNAKLKVWADRKPGFWKLAILVLPLLSALLIAGSLTVDNVHNVSDIVVGAGLGIVMALITYRASYASVWDWRYNHIPLAKDKDFSYGNEEHASPEAHAMTATGETGVSRNEQSNSNRQSAEQSSIQQSIRVVD